jgi:hypothetical protein
MTILEFLRSRRKAEYPVFANVLKAMPTGRFAEIVWTLAHETKACCELVDIGQFNWVAQTPPDDAEVIVSEFQKNYTELDDRIGRMDDSGWQKKARLLIEGKLFREAPVGEFLWYIFFDAIHHRGQLSTYIRPMGGQVPSIYGPSGDDSGS